MKTILVLFLHLLNRLATLLGNGGAKALLAENLLLKQQLLVLSRHRWRAPSFSLAERLLLGFWSSFLSPRRLLRAAIHRDGLHAKADDPPGENIHNDQNPVTLE